MDPLNARKRAARKRLVNAILVGVALALLSWTVYNNRAAIQEVFSRKPDGIRFAIALMIYLVAMLLTFVRWWILVKAQGLEFHLRDAFRLGFIGNVFNLVIPGAIGGDFVKAAFLIKEHARRTQAIASMVIDRLVGLLGLFVLAGVAGLLTWSTADRPIRTLIIVVWCAVAAGILLLAVVFRGGMRSQLRGWTAHKPKLHQVVLDIGAMADAYRCQIPTVAGSIIASALIHSLFVCAFTLVDQALFPDTAPGWLEHYLMVPLALFTTVIPLPFGALGLSEQFSRGFFNMVGYANGDIAMLGFRVIMYAAGAISLAVYLLHSREVQSLRELEKNVVQSDPETVPDAV
jgi:uncharacterized membrane protein YbhN (UPF0104 family)